MQLSVSLTQYALISGTLAEIRECTNAGLLLLELCKPVATLRQGPAPLIATCQHSEFIKSLIVGLAAQRKEILSTSRLDALHLCASDPWSVVRDQSTSTWRPGPRTEILATGDGHITMLGLAVRDKFHRP